MAQAGAGAGIAANMAQGAVGAYSAVLGGRSQQSMYNYQAGVAQVNAAVAKQDANYATVAGGVSAEESGMRSRFQVGQTKATYGAGNISTTSGSPSKVVSSEINIGQENEGIISANAAKQAYGFNVKAAGDTATAGADILASKTSGESETLNVASSIIGAVSSVSSKWTQAGQAFGSGSGSGGGGNADSDPTYSNYGFDNA